MCFLKRVSIQVIHWVVLCVFLRESLSWPYIELCYVFSYKSQYPGHTSSSAMCLLTRVTMSLFPYWFIHIPHVQIRESSRTWTVRWLWQAFLPRLCQDPWGSVFSENGTEPCLPIAGYQPSPLHLQSHMIVTHVGKGKKFVCFADVINLLQIIEKVTHTNTHTHTPTRSHARTFVDRKMCESMLQTKPWLTEGSPPSGMSSPIWFGLPHMTIDRMVYFGMVIFENIAPWLKLAYGVGSIYYMHHMLWCRDLWRHPSYGNL